VLAKEAIGLLNGYWEARIDNAKTLVCLIELERVVIYMASRLLVLVERWGIESVLLGDLIKLHQSLEDRYLLGDRPLRPFSKMRAHSIKLAERDPLSSLTTLEGITMLLELHHYSHKILGPNHDQGGPLDHLGTRRYIDTYLQVLTHVDKDLLRLSTQPACSFCS
jgi:hypothetical protein